MGVHIHFIEHSGFYAAKTNEVSIKLSYKGCRAKTLVGNVPLSPT